MFEVKVVLSAESIVKLLFNLLFALDKLFNAVESMVCAKGILSSVIVICAISNLNLLAESVISFSPALKVAKLPLFKKFLTCGSVIVSPVVEAIWVLLNAIGNPS